MRDAHPHTGDGGIVEIAHLARRAAAPQFARGHHLAFGQHGTGGEHRIRTDHRLVHRNGAQADEAAILDGAAMDHRHMADQYVVTDDERRTARVARALGVAMAHAAILDVRPFADHDPADVGAQDAIVPH